MRYISNSRSNVTLASHIWVISEDLLHGHGYEYIRDMNFENEIRAVTERESILATGVFGYRFLYIYIIINMLYINTGEKCYIVKSEILLRSL